MELNDKESKFLCIIYKMTKACTVVWDPHMASVLKFVGPQGW